VTKLDKPVVRETVQAHRGRPLVITLEPAGYVEIRPKGLRGGEVYRMSFEQIMLGAAWKAGQQERADRARERRRITR
jgi:hypothetical protein